MMKKISPCLYCSRVANPGNCDNKKCRPWQIWFMEQWDQTRKRFTVPMQTAALQQSGVPLGGHRYDSPHRVREYRKNGPCAVCKLPQQLCDTPCPALRVWKKTCQEVPHELEE